MVDVYSYQEMIVAKIIKWKELSSDYAKLNPYEKVKLLRKVVKYKKAIKLGNIKSRYGSITRFHLTNGFDIIVYLFNGIEDYFYICTRGTDNCIKAINEMKRCFYENIEPEEEMFKEFAMKM